MVMRASSIAAANSTAWSNRVKGVLERCSSLLNEGASWQQDSFAIENPQNYAYYMLQDAVTLLINGYVKEADKLFPIAELAAQSVLQTERFYRGGPIDGYFEEETAIALGKAMCLATAHDAHWYYTNVKNPSILRDAAEWYAQYLELSYKMYKKDMPLEDGMWRYILAESFDDAVEWYHARFRKALTAPVNDKRYLPSKMHVLYFLAEYARGNSEILPAVRAGLKRWYNRSVDRRSFQLDEERRAWFYFWHHYVGKQNDIRQILMDSRGY